MYQIVEAMLVQEYTAVLATVIRNIKGGMSRRCQAVIFSNRIDTLHINEAVLIGKQVTCPKILDIEGLTLLLHITDAKLVNNVEFCLS
jgi:hypothetical protein